MGSGTGTDTRRETEDGQRTGDGRATVPLARVLTDGDIGGAPSDETESNIIRGED